MSYKRRQYAQVLRLLKACDIAIEIVDARDIQGTRLPKLDRQFKSKVLMVATKSDLVPGNSNLPSETDGITVIPFSARTRRGLAGIFRFIRNFASSKGLDNSRVVIFGIPNVGKSSLINVMRGRHSARTGFRPGVTKGPQWITIRSGILLYDTPGVIGLNESFEDLAIKGAVDIDIIRDPESVALKLISRFRDAKNPSLTNHYGVSGEDDENTVLDSIARARGLLLKGGEPNTFEAARVVLRDFQKGRFVLLLTGPGKSPLCRE